MLEEESLELFEWLIRRATRFITFNKCLGGFDKEISHQSHTKYCWLKRVRFGQKKESTRPPGWQ